MNKHWLADKKARNLHGVIWRFDLAQLANSNGIWRFSASFTFLEISKIFFYISYFQKPISPERKKKIQRIATNRSTQLIESNRFVCHWLFKRPDISRKDMTKLEISIYNDFFCISRNDNGKFRNFNKKFNFQKWQWHFKKWQHSNGISYNDSDGHFKKR